MEMQTLINQILLLASEDYSGLWEVYYEAKDIYVELSQDELIGKSRNAVLDLLEYGLIQLYWCKEPLTNDRVTPVDQNDVKKALSEIRYWESPVKDSTSLRFITTPEGEIVFKRNF